MGPLKRFRIGDKQMLEEAFKLLLRVTTTVSLKAILNPLLVILVKDFEEAGGVR